jgi:PIN domain nuclease of toxin-antitoxin system
VTSYVLDTHVWLWLQTTPERVRKEVVDLLADRANTVLLSAASSWEIAIKYRLGKLPLPEPPAEYVPERMRLSGVTALPVEHAHALRVADLPEHHGDPFDRLIIAQAQLLNVPIVTADGQFGAYEVETIPACSRQN